MLSIFMHRRRKRAAEAIQEAAATVATAADAVGRVKRARGERALVAGVLWASTFLLARGLLELSGLPAWARMVIAVTPVVVFLYFLWVWRNLLAAMDELERRIQLDALAVAFPVVVVMLMTLGLMELAVPLDRANWSYRHVWSWLPAVYFAALWWARRRYL